MKSKNKLHLERTEKRARKKVNDKMTAKFVAFDVDDHGSPVQRLESRASVLYMYMYIYVVYCTSPTTNRSNVIN